MFKSVGQSQNLCHKHDRIHEGEEKEEILEINIMKAFPNINGRHKITV